VLTEPRELLI